MSNINLNPLKGFRDLYPKNKAIQNYIFQKLKESASFFGFEEYDGPLIESTSLYLEKSSKELVENQTFQIKSKKDEELVLRPEMTPTLARMIAKEENNLVFPLKLFNLGLRYRYEAPQKGRSREFYQADFDILSNNPELADMEILQVVVNLFTSFGAKENDFVVYINSRKYLQEEFKKLSIDESKQKSLLDLIDRKDKLPSETFTSLLSKLELTQEQEQWVLKLEIAEVKNIPYFKPLADKLEMLGIAKYIRFNPLIVRGLDYYTDLIFEVKSINVDEKGEVLNRSVLGGGRYDNLISYFGGKQNMSGVGFATSDVVLQEFLQDKNLLPQLNSKKTTVLVTIFSEEMTEDSIEIAQYLRKFNIAAELYLDATKKLDKQLKYANQNNIPFVLIVGPEEKEKGIVKIKNMKTTEQMEIKLDQIQNSFTS